MVHVNKRSLIVYLAVLAISLVFASINGGPIAYAWLYSMLLLVPLSVFYIFLNYRFLRIFQEIEVHKITKGEDHTYRAIIENAGILPIHKMRLCLYDDRCNMYELCDGQEISLGTYEKKEISSGISCKYAGAYNIGIDSVAFSDPFQIFEVELDVPYTFRAIVSPQITSAADAALELENLVNSTGLKSDRLFEDIPGSDMRPYERGDSLSSINWKVSARLNELTVRVPDKMEKRRVTILLLAANVPEKDKDIEYLKKRDYFLEFAVSAAWHFAREGVPVRLVYPSGKVSESMVDSYKSFMDFYSIAADGIFYSSDEDFADMKSQIAGQRSSSYDDGTSILIREDPEPGESHCTVCD